jgi:hypothetical protein
MCKYVRLANSVGQRKKLGTIRYTDRDLIFQRIATFLTLKLPLTFVLTN